MNRKPDMFTKSGVEDYEKSRYRGIDQRFVDAREKTILNKIFDLTAAGPGIGLDIPCGYGRFSRLFVERGASLVSSDYSFHMVKRARDRVPKAAGGGVVADAKQRLPFRDRAATFLLSMRFFHHIHDPAERESILGEFGRVTKNWVAASFYLASPFHLVQRSLRRRIKRRQRRIKMISRKELRKAASGAGLEIVKVYPVLRGIHAQHIILLKPIRNGTGARP